MKLDVYADGSATLATMPGGWGFVLVIDGVKHSEGFGHLDLATNNDAELEAAIQGLAAALKLYPSLIAQHDVEVTLVSDSQIILGWTDGSHRFKQEKKRQKFVILQELVRRMGVKTRWVRGHSGDEWNERCDKLAKLGRKGEERELQAEEEIKKNSKIGKKLDGVVCFWHHGILKVCDLTCNIVENYDKDVHGSRSSKIEIR